MSEGQESSFAPTASDVATQSARPLDLQFQLDPVELQINEELRWAKRHYDQGEWRKSVDQLSMLLAGNPHHQRFSDALFLRAESLMQLRRYAEAKKDFEQLLARTPNTTQTVQARFRIAESTMFLRERMEAERILERFRADFPGHELNAYVLPYLADTVAKSGATQRAHALYAEALEQYPDGPLSAECKLQSASLHLREMRLASLSGDTDRAFELYDQLRNGEDALVPREATQIMVELLLAQKDYSRAEQLIRPLAEARRSLVSQNARTDHQTSLFLYALSQRGLLKYNQANQLLGRIRLDTIGPDFAERVLLARIETFNTTEDFEAAVQQGLAYEQRFPNGRLLIAVQSRLIESLIGVQRRGAAKIKFRQLQQMANASPVEVARAARILGEASYKSGDLQGAREAFAELESVHQNDDDLPQAISSLAWIALKEGKLDEATVRFEEFIARFSGHPSESRVRLALAETLTAQDRQAEAIEVLSVFERPDPKNSLQARGLYQLAKTLCDDPKELARAHGLVEQLLENHPQFDQRGAALYLSGIVQQGLNRSTADEPFTELVEQHRTSKYWSDALYRLAEGAAERDSDQAKKYLTRLISSERDRHVLPHALYLKGRLESAEKNWDAARETLRELLRKFPTSPLVPVARYGVAESFFQQQEFDRALELFELLDREYEFKANETWGAMVRLRRAQLLVKKQELVSAIRVVEQVEIDFPGFPFQHEVDYLVGRAHAARGDFTFAREHYAKVVASDGENLREITAMAKWMLGESYVHQKQYAAAIGAFERLIDSVYPHWQAASHLQIGKCYELMQDIERAREAYSRVVVQFGDTESVEEAQQRLRELEQES